MKENMEHERIFGEEEGTILNPIKGFYNQNTSVTVAWDL